ncbi:hypothetical protein D3C73_1528040 [compost metagenome]
MEHDNSGALLTGSLPRSYIFAVHSGSAYTGKIQMKTFRQPARKFRRHQFIIQRLGIEITQRAFPVLIEISRLRADAFIGL